MKTMSGASVMSGSANPLVPAKKCLAILPTGRQSGRGAVRPGMLPCNMSGEDSNLLGAGEGGRWSLPVRFPEVSGRTERLVLLLIYRWCLELHSERHVSSA